MRRENSKSFITELFNFAGIELNGSHPWDIQIHNDAFYSRLIKEESLGLGEAYMDGWWDCEQLDQFFERIIAYNIEDKIDHTLHLKLKIFIAKIINHQTKKRALQVGKKHYDIGNNLFKIMLDSRMNYSCGYWKNASTLEEAQRNKLELACQKLMLKPGMRVLDIGCGFGAFAKYAAQNYGVSVCGVTISKKQYEYAIKNCSGLPIEIKFLDYRDITGEYDRIVSIGMFEHVGPLNYLDYFHLVKKSLKKQGLFLLHSIGANTSQAISDEWISTYIFPEGVIPSIPQISTAFEGLFVMEDWQNFGSDYDKTLMAWHHHFNQQWASIKNDYDDRFFRMWNYYLLSCAGSFRARYLQLWQIVLSNGGIPQGSQAIR